DAHDNELAVLVTAAGTDGDDFALLRLLLGGVGDNDATLGFFLGFNTLDDNTVVQGTEFKLRHDHPVAAAMRPVLMRKSLNYMGLALYSGECHKPAWDIRSDM